MSEGNHSGVDPQNLQELERLVKEHSPAGVGFCSCAIYNDRTDSLIILDENCSYTEEPVPSSNISILRKNYGENANEIVGVIVHNWRMLTKNF